MESSLLVKFRETCAAHADRPAIVDARGVLGFADYGAQVDRLAAWLHGQGLRSGEAVAVSIADERDHLLASLALLRLGCPQVTFSTPDPPSQRSALIAKCRVVAVLGDAVRSEDGVPTIIPDFEAITSPLAPACDAPVPGDDAVAALFTGSGTTGTFKAIPITHRAMTLQAFTRHTAVPFGVEYVPSPVEFLYPKKHRLRSAVTGYTSLLQVADHSDIPAICRRHGVHILRLSPLQVQSLAEAGPSGDRLPEGIAVYVGGSRISGPLRASFQANQVQSLYVEYGATETGNIAVASPDMHRLYPDGVGPALPGVELQIVDEEGNPLPPDVEGLIRIRTPGMAQGYLDDEELTARMFRDGWYQGGDRGALTEDGVLVFGGRADDMMILNSINIFPAEIEKVAENFPGVVDCAAFPLRSAVHGDIPMLAVVGGDGCDLKGLMSFCRERLGIRAPRKVIGLPEIPRNAQGKVVRRELSARAAQGEFQ
jgi:acyl-coenzyme A synthetase/AMP-(fatty) acid ligase